MARGWQRWVFSTGSLLGICIFIAGCVSVSGGLSSFALVLGLLGLVTAGIVGCTREPASQQSCCVDGLIATCACPAGVECNYGWFQNCGDGTCTEPGGSSCDGDVVDDAEVDAEAGTWQPCCEGTQITTCFCPADAICNYGWFEACADGTCNMYGSCGDDVGTSDVSVEPDASTDASTDVAPDAEDGTWQACCQDGELASCFCPAGAACNYWFTECADGSCAMPNSCPEDADVGTGGDVGDSKDVIHSIDLGDGVWEDCCQEGKITTCFCPAGVACNYWFEDCGEGTCGLPDQCPK